MLPFDPMVMVLVNTLMSRVMDGVSALAAADIARAEGLVAQALAASPRSALAHYAKGDVLRAQRRFDEAIPAYEMVLAINRNAPGALHLLGQCKLFAGSIEEVIPLEEQAVRRSPRDPQINYKYNRIGPRCIFCNHSGIAVRSRPPRLCLWPQR